MSSDRSSRNSTGSMNESNSFVGEEPSPLEAYYEDVIKMIEDNLRIGIEQLKADLMKVVDNKKPQGIDREKVHDACEKIFQKAKKHFEKNMNKFILYSAQNIFVPANSASNSSIGINNNIGISEDAELMAINEELIQARKRHEKLCDDYIRITSEYRDMDVLLSKMRDSLFELRVSSQNLEDFTTNQSLGSSVAYVQQRRDELEQHKRETQEYLQRLDGNSNSTNKKKVPTRMDSSEGLYFEDTTQVGNEAPPTLEINVTKNTSALRGIANNFSRK